MLIRPLVLNPSPSIVILMLGGLVGGLLGLGIMYGMTVAGWPPLDVLLALGGTLSSTPEVALGAGAALFLLGTTVVLPLLAAGVWTILPGREGSLRGTVIKGIAVGSAHWIILGSALGLTGLLGSAEAPGFMGVAAGGLGMVLLAAASLACGLAIAGIAFAEQGISAMDTIGWNGFTHAAAGPLDLGAHRSGELGRPGPGERPWRSD